PLPSSLLLSFFFFNYPSTTEIYPLSLHDALPICLSKRFQLPLTEVGYLVVDAKTGQVLEQRQPKETFVPASTIKVASSVAALVRSEEHTSELQSLTNLVCRLLLEKKKKTHNLPTA